MPKTSSAEAARLALAAAIAEAAYFKAARRDFAPGSEVDDWLEAEREILASAKASKPGRSKAKPKPKSEAKAKPKAKPALKSKSETKAKSKPKATNSKKKASDPDAAIQTRG